MKPQRSDSEFETEDFFRIRQLPEVPPRAKIPLHGSSRRATEADLREYLDPTEPVASQLPDASLVLETEEGHRLCGVFKRTFHIPDEIRRRNMLIVGQIGSGKTEQLILPLAVSDIRDARTSVIIVDFKGDLHHKLQPFMRIHRPGQRIDVVNFANRRRTTRAWNPHALNTTVQSALDDAQSFCEASQTRESNRDSIFWDGSAARWVAALILRLRERHGTVCPADVQAALELPRGKLIKLLKGDDSLAFGTGVASFLDSGSHNAETVLATAQMYYRIFQEEDLAAVTSRDELRFESLFRKPSVLILEISQRDVARLRPVLNLFFAQLFREIARFAENQPGCRLPVPLNIHLDDFAAALGRIPEIGQHLNMARSRDVRVTAATQSLSQLEHFYGTESDSVVAGFSTYIFKSPVTLRDAEWASQYAGTCTVETIEETQQLTCEDRPQWETSSRTLRLHPRRVLLPEEIRLAPEHFLYGRASTVILPQIPVFQAWFRPAYDTPGLAEEFGKVARRRRQQVLRRKPLTYVTPNLLATAESSLTSDQLRKRVAEVREACDWSNTSGSARKWWTSFEAENRGKMELVLKMLEELAERKATINEFFLAYVYSGTDHIQANLHYLDYTRLKKAEEQKKKTT